jgi:hypothetical protein
MAVLAPDLPGLKVDFIDLHRNIVTGLPKNVLTGVTE